MNPPFRSAVPAVPGIDLEFCPRTYFLPPEFLAESLDDEMRAAIGRIHPAFMGGEYLPKLLRNEIEIARISLASTTADQISVRARKLGDSVAYRIVDLLPFVRAHYYRPAMTGSWSIKSATGAPLSMIIETRAGVIT